MKIYFLLSLLVLGISTIEAKGHHNNGHQHRGKTTELPKPAKEDAATSNGEVDENGFHHEMTNRMNTAETRRRSAKPVEAGMQKQKQAKGETHMKKGHKEETSLHRYAFEHNVDKKPLDDDKGIPMEQEHLIHVTPIPPKAKQNQKLKSGDKSTKSQKKHHLASTVSPSGAKNQTKPSKGHKNPKKFNKKIHNMKKVQKKEKNDKKNEKREKKMKKLKALHKATTAKSV